MIEIVMPNSLITLNYRRKWYLRGGFVKTVARAVTEAACTWLGDIKAPPGWGCLSRPSALSSNQELRSRWVTPSGALAASSQRETPAPA